MSNAAVPRYQQLKQLIIRRISSGELKPNDRVPSENELVDSTGVSRMTANRALRELTDEGYVERVAGVGTFVADFRAVSHVLDVRNIAEEIAARGHLHSARVVLQEEVEAGGEVAASLRIDRGEVIQHVRLVHAENDLSIQLEDRYVLSEFAPDFLEQDFTMDTPSAYLSSVQPLQEADHIVRAAMPGPEIRDALEMPAGEPCLVVTRRTWAGGRPVTYASLWHPADRFELSGHYSPPGAAIQKTEKQHD